MPALLTSFPLLSKQPSGVHVAILVLQPRKLKLKWVMSLGSGNGLNGDSKPRAHPSLCPIHRRVVSLRSRSDT